MFYNQISDTIINDIKSLAEKSLHNGLDSEQWKKFLGFYPDAETFLQNEILSNLSKYSGIKTEILGTLFKMFADPSTEEKAFNELHKLQENVVQQISPFKSKVLKKYPLLNNSNISLGEWVTMHEKFTSWNRKKLTSPLISNWLYTIRNTNYRDLNGLQQIQPSRKCKTSPVAQEESEKRKCPKFFKGFNSKSPLIIQNDENRESEHKKVLEEYDIRQTELTPVSSPTKKEYPGMKLQTTPGGTRVEMRYKIDSLDFYKQSTPPRKTEEKKGKLQFPDITNQKLKDLLPQIALEKTGDIEFRVSLESIKARKLEVRHISQKKIMQISCSDVFRAHGIDIPKEDSHSYHWAHLIAFFLGGIQDNSNLVASTASANFNTLEIVELFVREKLSNEPIEHISIKVTPEFLKESTIPAALIYNLEWESKDQEDQLMKHKHTYVIKPTSYERIDHTSLKMLNEIRNVGELPVSRKLIF